MPIDIQQIINDKVTEMLNEGVITQKIQETIEEAVSKCIKESITSWHVTDLIKEKMKDELSKQIESISFAGYTQHVVDTVLNLVEQEKQTDIAERVRESFKGMFIPNNKEYTIDDIVDAFVNCMNDSLDYDAKYDLDGRYYAHLSSSDNNRYFKLVLAESEEVAKKGSYRRSSMETYYEILFHKKSGKEDEYTVFLIYDTEGVMTKRFDREHYNKFEQLLINMYLHNNIIRDKHLEVDHVEEIECYADIEM